MPSSRQRETAPRLVSSRPLLDERPSNGETASDARPSIPAPCVNVARRSRDGAPGGPPPQRPHRTNSGRRNVRRHACRSARRGLESAWVRPRIVVEVASPPSVPCSSQEPHGNSQEEPTRRRRRLGSRSPVRFHDVRKRNDLGRTRKHHLARNRDARLWGRRQGRQRWSAGTRRAREENARSPADPSHQSAHGVVKTPSAPVSRSQAHWGVARRRSEGAEETRSPHDTMGARY